MSLCPECYRDLDTCIYNPRYCKPMAEARKLEVGGWVRVPRLQMSALLGEAAFPLVNARTGHFDGQGYENDCVKSEIWARAWIIQLMLDAAPNVDEPEMKELLRIWRASNQDRVIADWNLREQP